MADLNNLFEILAKAPRELMGAERDDLPPLAVENDRLRFLLDTVVVAYDRAVLDPAARIPMYLHGAIEAARK